MEWVPVVLRAEPPLVVEPVEYLVRGWRNWYLASEWEAIMKYFEPLFREKSETQPQLCLKDKLGNTMPWHLPLGVWVDIWSPKGSPFELCLALCPPQPVSIDPLEIHQFFLQQIKESSYIRDGSSRAVMTMSPAESQALWSAVCKRNDEEYQRLLPVRTIRKVPMKLWLGETLKYLHCEPSETLGVLLNRELPELFTSTRLALDAQALLRGGAVPLGAPLEQLYEFKYVDGFLHIVVIKEPRLG